MNLKVFKSFYTLKLLSQFQWNDFSSKEKSKCDTDQIGDNDILELFNTFSNVILMDFKFSFEHILRTLIISEVNVWTEAIKQLCQLLIYDQLKHKKTVNPGIMLFLIMGYEKPNGFCIHILDNRSSEEGYQILKTSYPCGYLKNFNFRPWFKLWT